MSSPRPIVRPAFAAFLVIFVGAVVCTAIRPRSYRATAELEQTLFRATGRNGEPLVESAIGCGPDLHWIVRIAKSDLILDRVAARLSPPPAEKSSDAAREDLARLLRRNLEASAVAHGGSLHTRLSYRHTSPDRAALWANVAAEEVLAHLLAIHQESNASALRLLEEFLSREREAETALAASLEQASLSEEARRRAEAELRDSRARTEQVQMRLTEARKAVGAEPLPFRLIRATPPSASDYVSPNHLLDLVLGLLAGLVAAGALTLLRRRFVRR